MPSYLNEIRERQAIEASKQSSPVPIVIAAIAAFAFGAMAATGFVKLPAVFQKDPPAKEAAVAAQATKAEAATVSSSGWGRMGNAEKANILLSCVPRHKLGLNGSIGRKIDSADIYKILQAGTQMTRVASVVGQPGTVDDTAFASLWADVADCAMAQNGWTLCDPDNRALAVEATLNLVHQVKAAGAPRRETDFDKVMKTVNGNRKHSKEYQLYAARATRDRVLDSLRNRVKEGRFVASDFGYFPPDDVAKVLKETKPQRDACAEKR